MFGYITICKPELKVKDYERYRAYYCGLCHSLRERFGRSGQITLSYDMTFIVILLSSLYEKEPDSTVQRCMVHPFRQIPVLQNLFSEYCADMNILLTYYHLLDDWQDEKSLPSLMGAGVLKAKARKVVRQYPRQARAIRNSLKKLARYEACRETNLDLVSGSFGSLMAELFVWRQDEWEENLRRFGFFFGKFIYLMDAYDDLQEDLKKNRYNPLISLYQGDAYEETCLQILNMMMAECSLEFEKLPCLQDADILRNILYAGVWTKYSQLQTKRKEKKEQNYDQ